MLATDDKSISTLASFGLTTLQARIYLTLAKIDKSAVRNLSESTKVARQDIYRIVTELFDLGLVEKIITSPNEFRAIPIEEAMTALIHRRNQETIELQQEASELLKHYHGSKIENDVEEEESQFDVITEKQAQLLRTRKAFEKAQNSIIMITKLSFLAPFAHYLLNKKNGAFSSNVNVRVVTQKYELEESLKKHLQILIEKPFFKIRYIPAPPTATVILFDDKEVAIAISARIEMDETPFLWSTNPSFTKLAQNYLENKWIKAAET